MILDPVSNTTRSRIPTDSLLAFVSLSKQSSLTTYAVDHEGRVKLGSQSSIRRQSLNKHYTAEG
jgi:hypothetical protein